jgi:hypothetical protein
LFRLTSFIVVVLGILLYNGLNKVFAKIENPFQVNYLIDATIFLTYFCEPLSFSNTLLWFIFKNIKRIKEIECDKQLKNLSRIKG